MTRDQALEKVRKLRALTEDRGATPAEAATARRRADALVDRFALAHSEVEGWAEPAPATPAPPSGTAQPFPAGWVIVNLGGWVPTSNTHTPTFVFYQ
jgi:hypothetical protein